MLPVARYPRHGCPAAAAEDALLLLASGRVDRARRVLEALPGLVAETIMIATAGWTKATADAEAARLSALAERRDLEALLARSTRELHDLKSTLAVARQAAAQPRAKRHEILAAALADGRTTAERVAEVLRVDPRHAFELAAGRVGLSRGAWQKLFAEVGIEEDRT